MPPHPPSVAARPVLRRACAGLGAAVTLALAACAPRFERVGLATPQAGAAPEITIDRIELTWSNVYLVRKADAANAAILVDAGSPQDRDALAAALAARGVAPGQLRAVVVTHAHADHAGCARWLQQQGAAIVLGADDAGVAARGANDPLHATNLLGAVLAPLFMFGFDGFTPDVAIARDAGARDLGALGFPEVVVAPAPGHTPGSIVARVGGALLSGDLVKGGLVLGEHTPSEHLYQTDRLADHRALAAELARGPATLYPGHRGPLDARDVAAWLSTAAPASGDRAIALEADARAELTPRAPRVGGGLAGLRVRGVIGRAGPGLGWAFGADARAGYLDGARYEADAHPLGVALRTAGGAFAMTTLGVGLGGLRGASASHATVELSGELPVGGVRLVARASAGWALGGPAVEQHARLGADETGALLGVRLGRDRAWGDYAASHGPFLALTYRDLGGRELIGVALGFSVFAEARGPRRSEVK